MKLHRASPCDNDNQTKSALKGRNENEMSQSLSQLYVHLIFSTKERVQWLKKPVHEELRA